MAEPEQWKWWDLSAHPGCTCSASPGDSSTFWVIVGCNSSVSVTMGCLSWSGQLWDSETPTCVLHRSGCLCLQSTHGQAHESSVTGMAFKQVLRKHNLAYLCSSCVLYPREGALYTATLVFKEVYVWYVWWYKSNHRLIHITLQWKSTAIHIIQWWTLETDCREWLSSPAPCFYDILYNFICCKILEYFCYFHL